MPTYGNLRIKDRRIILEEVKPHVSIRLKNIFARIAKHQTKQFALPLTDEMCADLMWFMERYPFSMKKADQSRLKKGAKQFRIDRESTEAILLPGWQAPTVAGFRPGYAPNFMQMQAIEMLKRRRRLLLGDDVGQGKTWVAMAAALQKRPVAVIVEPHLAEQWTEEFIVEYTTLTAHIIDGTRPYDLPQADVYVFRYSNISGWVDIAGTGYFSLVVFDEIQQLRTGTETGKGAAAAVFADNADWVLGLSATPIFGYGSEIWNIMRIIDADVLGSWEEFTREWCVMGSANKWIVTDPDALGAYLVEAGCHLRRLREGRPINKIIVNVDYDDSEAERTEDLARALAMKVLESKFGESGEAARQLDSLQRRVTGVGKAKGIAAYAKLLLAAGHPVLLSAWHRDVYEILLKELKDFRVALYTGSETTKQKNKVKRDFIAGRLDAVLISNRSGAGLDGLQKRCHTLIVGELDWAAAVYYQLAGRLDRPGQPMDQITMIFCVCDYGSDPTIMSVNALKSDQLRGIMDPGSGVAETYSDVSHIKLLAEQYLERSKA
ncbi:DEAD/DEAH box helicase family protein [Shinella zoogloeoides]|uniref:DEAD/DEAH box helicase family protein n=1 Tax=Shinella zoogloeoides TaxID=352475 RepID=UPI00299E0081|nr:DEAD/DEAH box helicase family protein [Shinella zoogloeoides]